MSRYVYDKPIELFEMNEESETYQPWADCPKLHAHINRNVNRSAEYQAAQTTQHSPEIAFVVRYVRILRKVAALPQLYRIKYDGEFYDIIDADDYMMKHRELKLVGVSVHGNNH